MCMHKTNDTHNATTSKNTKQRNKQEHHRQHKINKQTENARPSRSRRPS